MNLKFYSFAFVAITAFIAISLPVKAVCNITDNTYINSDTVLIANETICNVADTGDSGVIIINDNNITLDCGGSWILNGTGIAGFYVHSKNNVTIKNCNTTGYNSSIHLSDSSNVTLTNNNITNSLAYGFYVSGGAYKYYNHSIDTSNTIDGKPIYYLKNVQNEVYDGSTIDIGSFSCFLCNNVTIKNLNITKNYRGIFFWGTNNSFIQNNIFNSNYVGISLNTSSNNNTIQNNTVSSNSRGIFIDLSSNNTIQNNTANSNSYGITLWDSRNNTIKNNTVNSNTDGGIELQNSQNNTIQRNTVNSNEYSIVLVYNSANNTVTNNKVCYNRYAIANATGSVDNTIDNDEFCVEQIYPTNGIWYTSVSDFLSNVSNPIFRTSCQLYVNDSISRVNTTVYGHNITNFSYVPSQGYYSWYIYCNDSAHTNWANSSILYFGVKTSDGSSCSADTECTGGYCCSNACQSSSCPTTTTTTTPSGGGEYGGGGILPEAADKLVKTYSSIIPFAPPTISATDLVASKTDLTEIKIEVNERVTSVKITIEKLTEKPPGLTTPAAPIYQYINITKENLDDANLEQILLKFKVNNSWLLDNSIDTNAVALNRYTDKWTKLQTTKLSQDGNYTYYQAESPGFSYFAVTGELAAPTTTTIITSTTTTTTSPSTATTTTIPVSGVSIEWVAYAVIAAIIIAFFVWKFKLIK
jgi:PGF-pre-PGF domain-containing protein